MTNQELCESLMQSIDNTWLKARIVRHAMYPTSSDIVDLRQKADNLEVLLNKYKQKRLKSLPNTTIWMASQMIEASRDIADGFERLNNIDLG